MFLIPTHVLYLTGFALIWMLARDSFVYVTLEFGNIINLLLYPVQVKNAPTKKKSPVFPFLCLIFADYY